MKNEIVQQMKYNDPENKIKGYLLLRHQWKPVDQKDAKLRTHFIETTTNKTANAKTAQLRNNTSAQDKKITNKTQKSKESKESKELQQLDQPQGSKGPVVWPWIVGSLVIVSLILFIIWIIWRKIKINKKYNQTPEHFTQTPSISLNQKRNLSSHKMEVFKRYKKDVQIQAIRPFGGVVYDLKYKNIQNEVYSATYWDKVLKTDCYFQVQVDTLNSQFQFGFINQKYFQLFNQGIQTKIGRVGVSINGQGTVQVLGQVIYQYRWSLQYGDVIGLGITRFQKNKRVWVTKNGILLNPPTSDQIQKWLGKQQLSSSNKDAYRSLDTQHVAKDIAKKQDLQLTRKIISLPTTQSFDYYAVVGSWRLFNKFATNPYDSDQTAKVKIPTTLKVNVGGKVFRLRDDNLKSGLLADSIQKVQCCSCFPCL